MTRDRYGEVVDLDAPNRPVHDRRCVDGWLGLDEELRPIPCTLCRPHLAGGTATVNDCDPNKAR